jgi:hypothetical protein
MLENRAKTQIYMTTNGCKSRQRIRIRKATDPARQGDGSASARRWIRIRKATDLHLQGDGSGSARPMHPNTHQGLWIQIRIRLMDLDPHQAPRIKINATP